MRLSENKVRHERETPKSKVLAIKDKFKVFSQKTKKRGKLSVERRKKG